MSPKKESASGRPPAYAEKKGPAGVTAGLFLCVGGRNSFEFLYEYEKLMVIRYREVVNTVCRNYRKKMKIVNKKLTRRGANVTR